MLISLTESRICFSNDFLSPTQEWHILLFNVKKPFVRLKMYIILLISGVWGAIIFPEHLEVYPAKWALFLVHFFFFLWPLRKAEPMLMKSADPTAFWVLEPSMWLDQWPHWLLSAPFPCQKRPSQQHCLRRTCSRFWPQSSGLGWHFVNGACDHVILLPVALWVWN